MSARRHPASRRSTPRLAAEVTFQVVGEEAILLHAGKGLYYGLNPSGACVWQALAAGGSLETACRDLVAKFDVGEAQARSDVDALVADLLDHGLLESS